MGFLRNIVNGLDRRKVKMFSIFLLCSFLAWFISKLSEPYESGVTLELNYENLPDTLLIIKDSKAEVNARVSTNGFQFLSYNFSPKKIDLNLSKARTVKDQFYFPKAELASSIRGQISNNTKLVSIAQDTIFLNVFKVKSKEVPVRPNITLDLEQNYLMDGKLRVNPEAILLKGPASEIGAIRELRTQRSELLNLTEDFSIDLKLDLPENLENTVTSSSSVQVSGKIVRFSEKVFQVKINASNVPEGFQIKTFPNEVSLLCKASIEALKTIKKEDFDVIANYQDRVEDKMFLNISKSPESAYDVRLLENQVNFILEKK